MSWLRGHWQLFALLGLIFALWTTPVVLPLKLLVVLFHELAHGLMAVLTGGSIESLTVSPQEGGMAVTRGGSRFWTLTAGYLGSLLFGVALLLAALRSRADRAVMALTGAVLVLITVLYIRDPFAMAFTLATGAAMLAMAWWLGHAANDLALRVIGLSSVIYVPYDIFSDTLARAHLRSDARMLAEEIGGTTMFWGGLWLVASLGVIFLCLRYGLGRESNLHWPGTAPSAPPGDR